MKVTVIGKYNRNGIGKKSGKPYDLNYVQLTYKQNGIEGLAVREVMLDAKTYPLAGIQIGKLYDLDMDNGFVLGFELA